MNPFEFVCHHYHHFPGSERVADSLRRIEDLLITQGHRTMTKFDKLQSTLDALDVEVKNKIVPLLQAMTSGDQAKVDAMQAEAQALLDALTANDGSATATPETPAVG